MESFDAELLAPDLSLAIERGAIVVPDPPGGRAGLTRMARECGIDPSAPLEDADESARTGLLGGRDGALPVLLAEELAKSGSAARKAVLESFRIAVPCPSCGGLG